jgi:peptide/nickel transport system permease protein
MRMLQRLGRASLLLLLVAAGTLGLVRYAPGYFADAREMDAQYAGSARAQLDARRLADRSSTGMARAIATGWMHGQLGISRQYQVSVTELIRPRILVTTSLLGSALGFGWLSAIAVALPLSAVRSRSGQASISTASAVLLAVPIGALATIFLLTNTGGPAVAVGSLLAARDFKFVYHLLARQWKQPHLLFARVRGIPLPRILMAHLLGPLAPRLASLATMSFILALSLAVPAEVLFDVPGIGQLAWTAAMNRDLPLLLAITLLMAAAVVSAGFLSESMQLAGAHSEQV